MFVYYFETPQLKFVKEENGLKYITTWLISSKSGLDIKACPRARGM